MENGHVEDARSTFEPDVRAKRNPQVTFFAEFPRLGKFSQTREGNRIMLLLPSLATTIFSLFGSQRDRGARRPGGVVVCPREGRGDVVTAGSQVGGRETGVPRAVDRNCR